MSQRRQPWVALALLLLAVAPRALAEPREARTVQMDESSALPDDSQEGSDPEQAKLLFFEGRTQMDFGPLAAGCATLERSLALNPTVGTLLNLGLCFRRLGKLVSAHDYYRRTEVLATLRGDTKRRETAHEEASKLAPLRATLSLQIATANPSELEVRIDDVVQPLETWTRPMFIDAGEHQVSLRGGDRKPWQDRVRIRDGERQVLVVPDLVERPAAATPPAGSNDAKPTALRLQPAALSFTESRTSGLGLTRSIAIAVGAAGIVSLGIGLFYGARARNDDGDSESNCRPSTNVCNDKGLEARDSALANASRSTVLSLAGGGAIVGALALWFFAPGVHSAASEPRALSVVAGPSALRAELKGRF